MAKAMNFILGLALIIVGIMSIVGWGADYSFFLVAGIGVIIMFIPMGGKGATGNFFRRWVLGGFLIISGLGSFLYEVLPSFIGFWIAYIRSDSYLGGAIVIFIGLIYFFAAFRTTRDLSLRVT